MICSQEGKVGDQLFGIPQIFNCVDGCGGNGIIPLHQFLIVVDVVFGEKVYCGSHPSQILNGCRPLVSGVLQSFDVVLNVNEQVGCSSLLGLSKEFGTAGN